MRTVLARGAGAKCKQCDTAMDIIQADKFDKKWAYGTIAFGALFTLFGGLFLGIIIVVAGIYMAGAKETISCCTRCGYYFKTRYGDLDP
ncbi:hypothetical protein NNJEOMEG_00124 [Fundidesulfovibrio magnetotacticus]|uniref:LITAF domain-containing protein n=1 Tax=Fundidesulfovibrio magnetotacticus TaxID=2730080 RepID=A0A6V8LP69_9BACT|nr:hypothetical protein [Fundidesulfovibrio magnetotacticus]GFK92301.1 hypothetical protein NNJEOMEG_00124 [Fundidesulfovibrio magnetotacticus]